LLADALAALPAHPDAPELWLLEAQYSAERREFTRALDAAAQAEKSGPGAARPAITRANILWQMGQPANAVALLEDVFARHPNELELAFRLAQTLSLTHNSRKARQVLATASPLVSSPAVRSRWLSMEGETFESEGQNVKALHSYQAAARVLPTQPENHYTVARVLEALKRPAEAMAAVREGMKYEDSSGIARGHARLAQLENTERQLRVLRDQKLLQTE
jgi:predicted Zn-dependent protease